jgi:hypothetical protein
LPARFDSGQGHTVMCQEIPDGRGSAVCCSAGGAGWSSGAVVEAVACLPFAGARYGVARSASTHQHKGKLCPAWFVYPS